MKYLKLFESEKLFTEITLREMDRYEDDSKDIDVNICERLNKIRGDYQFYIEESNSMYPRIIKFKIDKEENLKYHFFPGGTIFSNNDEWYYVSFFTQGGFKEIHLRKYFKCDQWDGLIQCLKLQNVLK